MAVTYAFDFVLANFGMAIAARMPMMTTTISSSISVKPLRFMWLSWRGRAGYGGWVGGVAGPNQRQLAVPFRFPAVAIAALPLPAGVTPATRRFSSADREFSRFTQP